MLWTDTQSFLAYCRRLLVRYIEDATWGRDQMIGLAVAVAILAYQIKYGVISQSQTQSAHWALLKPYGIVLAVYSFLHLLLTAWRLDRDRDASIGLPLRIYAKFDGQYLCLNITNSGQTDRFAVEVWSMKAGLHQHSDTFSLRWKDAPNDTYLEIPSGHTGYAEVLKIPYNVKSTDGIRALGVLREMPIALAVEAGQRALIEMGIAITAESTKRYLHVNYFVFLDASDGHNISPSVYMAPLV